MPPWGDCLTASQVSRKEIRVLRCEYYVFVAKCRSAHRSLRRNRWREDQDENREHVERRLVLRRCQRASSETQSLS